MCAVNQPTVRPTAKAPHSTQPTANPLTSLNATRPVAGVVVERNCRTGLSRRRPLPVFAFLAQDDIAGAEPAPVEFTETAGKW
jgi:hypothetical protein